MFIDRVTIEVQAGNGGNGSNAIRHLRTRHKKIPDGGAGGRGGSVIFVTDENTRTLLDLNMQKRYKAQSGQQGTSNRRRGRSAESLEIRVPVGSVVTDSESGLMLRDLVKNGERLTVARGGQGGYGNSRKRSAVQGERGEQRHLSIELKSIADGGLIGFPNSGKSTLLISLTRAQSKVADYPFSTLEPRLGVLEDPVTYERITLCDVPGLIEGAWRGRGLGNDFLRHIERSRFLIHVVEMQDVDGVGPHERYQKINAELAGRDPSLARKRQIVVATKMDLESAQSQLKRFQGKMAATITAVSAQNGTGLKELKEQILKAAHEDKTRKES